MECSGIEALLQEQVSLSMLAHIPPDCTEKMSPLERSAALRFAEYVLKQTTPSLGNQ